MHVGGRQKIMASFEVKVRQKIIVAFAFVSSLFTSANFCWYLLEFWGLQFGSILVKGSLSLASKVSVLYLCL